MSDGVQSQNNHRNLIAEIRNRIQFLVMIAIFFSGLLYNFFNVYDKTKSNNVALSYGMLVALYLIVYLLFEIRKNKINADWLERINILTLVGVGMFLIPIIFVSSAEKIPNSSILLILYWLSLHGLLIVPLLLIIIILWSLMFKKQNSP